MLDFPSLRLDGETFRAVYYGEGVVTGGAQGTAPAARPATVSLNVPRVLVWAFLGALAVKALR